MNAKAASKKSATATQREDALIGCIGSLLAAIGHRSTNATVLDVRRYLRDIGVVVDNVDVDDLDRAVDFAKRSVA